MILEAKDEFGIELSKSYLIGDKLSDIEAGKNAGVKNLFLLSKEEKSANSDFHCIKELKEMLDFIRKKDENKKIVITGGAGFIGSNLATYFENLGADVLVVDIFRTGERFDNGNLKSFGHYKNLLKFGGRVLEGDINDRKLLKVWLNLSLMQFFMKLRFLILR